MLKSKRYIKLSNVVLLWIYKNGGYIGRTYNRITDIELVINDSLAYKTSLASSAGRVIVGGCNYWWCHLIESLMNRNRYL